MFSSLSDTKTQTLGVIYENWGAKEKKEKGIGTVSLRSKAARLRRSESGERGMARSFGSESPTVSASSCSCGVDGVASGTNSGIGLGKNRSAMSSGLK